MCGICGYTRVTGFRGDPDVVHKMCQTMIHRGPDEEGIWVKGDVALGMRRLRIIDLETGSQPIFNEDKTVVLVCNGEIYNFRQLRKLLEEKGHKFYTRTDTEVIVHCYEEWGEECVERLSGMFAIALWDERKRILLLVRDRVGKKPLYYSLTKDGGIIWGSEIKAILAHPAAPAREPDYEALHHYLSLQYVPDPWTAFQGIKELPPASYLLHKNGEATIKRYWDLKYVPKHKESEETLQEELRRRMQEATSKRLISDVPLGAFLSGGIDSSIVVALMATGSGERIKTFSIGFEEEKFSELPYARAVARKYNTEHHEFIARYNAAEIVPQLIEYFDEPFADSSALPTYYLAKMTREFVTVALTGDGGDETHAGYQRYWLDERLKWYERIPSFVRKPLESAFALIPEPLGVPIERNWIAGIKRLSQVMKITPQASILRWGSYFSDEMKMAHYAEEMRGRLNAKKSEDILSDWFVRAAASSFLDRSLYVDVNNYLPGDGLVKSDRMTMAHSLEGRSPFLDYELMEWVARLPESMKLRGRTHKYLLKKSFADMLPESVRKRGKQGFGIPVGKWFQKELRPLMEQYLLSDKFEKRNIFKAGYVRNLIGEHLRGRVDHGKRIWALLMMELWFQRYLDR
jgi:asparagine synthase (glutamine-hydrolysing)